MLRWAFQLALLLLVGCLIAALIRQNAFGLGTLWEQWWVFLEPRWELLEPVLGPWLTALRPIVDFISNLLARVL